MTILSGREIAEDIIQRQKARIIEHGPKPRLAIIQTKDDPAIELYTRIKQKYGAEIGAEVEIHHIPQEQAVATIQKLNTDPSVNGVIVQLPLSNMSQSEEILNSVLPTKDVDGLATGSAFDPATPTAILWLLEGNHIELKGKRIAVIGQGLLVGAPLTRLLRRIGYDVITADIDTPDLLRLTRSADIIITATGQPDLITSVMVKPGTVIIDAGVAVENGQVKGDTADDLRQREDISITPQKGGVGPLTVAALFENLLSATLS